MRPVWILDLGIASILGVVAALLYRFWLTYPILRNLTAGEWRAVAIIAAAVLGAACALIRLPTYLGLPAMAVALTLGGAWAGLSAPHDVPTTFLAELISHLRIFWPEIALFTAVSTTSSLCCAYLLRKNRDSH